MKLRYLALPGALAAVFAVWLAPVPVAGQAPTAAAKTWTPPRTPDGRPDLEGNWTYKNITPLERPSELAGKQVLTDEEAESFEQAENRRQNRDLIDPAKGGAGIYPPGGVVPYNEFWYDRGARMVGSKRTSLIVDPPDGRLPPLTPEAQKRASTRDTNPPEDQLGRPLADSYETRPLSERCIMMGNPVPMLSGPYNNNVQLVQGPGHVAILNEMIHEQRIVPLDGRPHLPQNIRLWLGDSRGHWEGDTLVVETTNFGKASFRGSSQNMHLVERFTRVSADTIDYQFTVDDAATWTRPWTAAFSLTKIPEQIYEYACQEGNYGIVGVLGGARADDKAAAKTGKKR